MADEEASAIGAELEHALVVLALAAAAYLQHRQMREVRDELAETRRRIDRGRELQGVEHQLEDRERDG